jgi:hypothetical protein
MSTMRNKFLGGLLESYISNLEMGPLAQSVEQRTFNPWVVGSIPTGPTQSSDLT